MHLASFLRTIVAVLLASGSMVGMAQPAEPQPKPNPFLAGWPAMCKSMIAKALSLPDLKPILEVAPVSEPAICGCVESGMREDKYLRLLFLEDASTIRSQIDQERFKPYFMGKMYGFSMLCIGRALDLSTNGIDPARGG